MKKLFSLALAIATASAALIPATAMALDSTQKYNVYIHNRFQEVNVGTWVIELDQPYDTGGQLPDLETCQYFVKWTNYCALPTRANLFIQEVSLPGESDCDLNSTSYLSTLIRTTPGELSRGFDKFNSKRTVVAMIAGQDGESGDITGVIQFSGGTVYGLAATPN